MGRLTQSLKKLLGISQTPSPPQARRPLWSIGIFTGTSPLTLGPDSRIVNPVITRESVTDVPASFVADPFLMRADGTWHLFFEVLNRRSGLGQIGLATSDDLAEWQYKRIVLAEPYHLSYPQVFEWQGTRYMVPESHRSSSIRLYKADPFPGEWRHVHTLLDGEPFSDTTLFRYEDRWWLFTQTSPKGKHDNLRLFFADDLFGAWTEHPSSPIIDGDPHSARPAGRVLSVPGGLLRFAQDCVPCYGLNVFAFEITTLTTTAYAERAVSPSPLFTGSSTGWNAGRMHHVDAHLVEPGHWVAAVDGAININTNHRDRLQSDSGG